MSTVDRAAKAFSTALSIQRDWRQALAEAGDAVRRGLDGSCDLALLFMTELFEGLDACAVPCELRKVLPFRQLIGCNTSGVIGGGREVEMEPAVTLMGMTLPGVRVAPFYLGPEQLKSLSAPQQLLAAIDVYPPDKPKFLALADPMSCEPETWIRLFNEAYPGAPVIGGMASGLAVGRPTWLLLGDEAFAQGSVGVALSGDVDIEVVVAQGCRPIGKPWIVTKAEGHVLFELGGRPPFEVLQEVVRDLSPQEQQLARFSLFAGLLMDEAHTQYLKGDFLVRNLMGYDAESGALMIGANLRVGQTLQFQLRDARTSDEDLRRVLERLGPAGQAARGALLVSCCGRGRGLYGEPDHDANLIQSLRGPLPLAGFFANGEIGPVGARNYVHGYTSSLAVIR